MSQKNKEGTLNLLYIDKPNVQEKKKNKPSPSKPRKKTKVKPKETIDNDNEIIIGVTQKPTKTTKPNNKRAEKKSAPKNKKQNKKISDKKTEKQIKKNRRIKFILKISALFVIIIGGTIFLMTSPLFNITEVKIINNSKFTEDTYISLSGITTGTNIYRISKNNIKEKIKSNAYVENVEVSRKLPNIVEITVQERKATFMIQYANSYVYINNQGYMLEISDKKINVPIIKNIVTKEDNFIPGNRLCIDDLKKLEDVLKIMSCASSNGISDLITTIDINDSNNYILYLTKEKKTVFLGDSSNLIEKFLYLNTALNDTKKLEGNIYLNRDLNLGAYFSPKKD